MGGLAIAELMISLITTYGPKAVSMYEDWKNKLPAGQEPTAEDWAALQKLIDDHNPDSY